MSGHCERGRWSRGESDSTQSTFRDNLLAPEGQWLMQGYQMQFGVAEIQTKTTATETTTES